MACRQRRRAGCQGWLLPRWRFPGGRGRLPKTRPPAAAVDPWSNAGQIWSNAAGQIWSNASQIWSNAAGQIWSNAGQTRSNMGRHHAVAAARCADRGPDAQRAGGGRHTSAESRRTEPENRPGQEVRALDAGRTEGCGWDGSGHGAGHGRAEPAGSKRLRRLRRSRSSGRRRPRLVNSPVPWV